MERPGDTLVAERQSSAGAGGSYTQDGRLIAIDTPLGKDKLLLTELAGEEQISGLFRFRIAMISEDQDINPGSLVGRNVTLWITRRDGERAPINGFVKRFEAGRIVMREFREYHAEIVPWLWFLTRTADCRIFQEITVPDMLKQVFSDFGFRDFETSGLTGTYPKLEYCVQYRETAFDFVSRWMEEVGLFCFFRHEAGRHVLVLGDHNLAFKPAGEAEVRFLQYEPSDITSWRHAYEYRSGRYAQKDFNFETPSASLLTQERSVLKLANVQSFEIFDYPGRYQDASYGQSLTRLRIEEEEAAYHTVTGGSVCASFHPGAKFKLARHDVASEVGKSYVLARVVHEASERSYFAEAEEAPTYTNSFVAFPADTRFRPPRVTERPFVHGPQTATVVGPAAEKIYPDKYGRVKLQFHWDRRGKRDEKSSCWVRVAQNWAGAGWGGVYIPHVGHEVVVSFLEGDPDR
ncbi:MAG: type VI secretion system tip protein VgrG, partial [Acetobacteraceae bacterium]|nr:type VI secretion system tip protein VgrG [Acetobacteraceae bacterium]